MNFTLGFSNTPGPIKPFVFIDDKGLECRSMWCTSYVMIAGRVGLCISCMSFYESFGISITANEAICQDIELIVSMIEKNI